jgi:arsenate reductase (glutaredoxin)
MKITVYQKPTCTTCRQVYKALKESGVDFDAVDYYVDPIPKDKLRSLLKKMGLAPRELLRRNEPIYKELGLAERETSDSELIDLMVSHPDLIQRPIVEKGGRAILARPAARLKEIL